MIERSRILKRIKDSVEITAPDATLIVYGSTARGDYNTDSDIDILILVSEEKVSYEAQKKIKYPLYHIEYDTGVLISPLVFSRNAWETKHRITPFYENVIREGIIL